MGLWQIVLACGGLRRARTLETITTSPTAVTQRGNADELPVIVVASIDDGIVPVRLTASSRSALQKEALAAVIRHNLSRRAVANCREGNVSCVATLMTNEALERRTHDPPLSCRLNFDRPRQREVHVLGDLDMFVNVEQRHEMAWRRISSFNGRLFVDAWPSVHGGALGECSLTAWIDVRGDEHGIVSLRLTPPHRRAGGGGSSAFPVRGELRVSVATLAETGGACGEGQQWLHGELSVVYRPFAEPDPPRKPMSQSELNANQNSTRRCAYATLLYDDASGYGRGAVALFQSLRDVGTTHEFLALVGTGVGSDTRMALGAMGVMLVDVAMDRPIAEASSALPALGTGQWEKLRLWDLPYDRVLYLDADAVVVRNVDELLESTALNRYPLAAVNDYFAGAVLLVVPNETMRARFSATLAQDSGRYVFGEQDFLNVHFSGSHALLAGEYHCLAEAIAQTVAAELSVESGLTDEAPKFEQLLLSKCAIVEFSSCARDGAERAWKPWHGRQSLRRDRRVCLSKPGPHFFAVAAIWEQVFARGLAELARAGVPKPP